MYPPCCPLHKNPHTLLARSPLVVSSAISEWWTPTLLKLCCCFHAVFFGESSFAGHPSPILLRRPALRPWVRFHGKRSGGTWSRPSQGGQCLDDSYIWMAFSSWVMGFNQQKWWFNGDLMGIWLKYTPMMARCNPRIIYGYVQVSEENVCSFLIFFPGQIQTVNFVKTNDLPMFWSSATHHPWAARQVRIRDFWYFAASGPTTWHSWLKKLKVSEFQRFSV